MTVSIRITEQNTYFDGFVNGMAIALGALPGFSKVWLGDNQTHVILYSPAYGQPWLLSGVELFDPVKLEHTRLELSPIIEPVFDWVIFVGYHWTNNTIYLSRKHNR